MIRNVYLENVASESSRHVLQLSGFEGAVMESIHISDSTFKGVRKADMVSGVAAIQFTNATVAPATAPGE